jgi:glycosyltransferase involved in cell wall biosynthesis
MKNASGKYCVFLDDDDLFFSDHIEVLVNALIKNKKASAAYSLAFEVPTQIVNKKRDYVEGKYFTQRLFFQEFDYSKLSNHNFLPIQSVLFERSLFFQRGGFDESLTFLEDWNLWLRYAHGNVFQYCAKTTSLYRTPMKNRDKEKRNRLFYDAYDIAKEKAYKSISQQKNNDKLAE